MSGWLTPMEPEAEMLDHVCGRCRTPWGISNPACPNAPKLPIPAARYSNLHFTDEPFSDDEAAAILESWSNE